MQRIFGQVEQGNYTVNTAGVQSSLAAGGATSGVGLVQASFPGATVTIYLSGTTGPASIYSDNIGTPKANPFTADADGYWFAYVPTGTYDVMYSSGSLPLPVSRAGYVANDPTQDATIVQAMFFNATPTFDASIASIFSMQLTGNVTSSAIANGQLGQRITISLQNDNVGGYSFVWPTTVLNPPTSIDTSANAITDVVMWYDGTKWRVTSITGSTVMPLGPVTQGAVPLWTTAGGLGNSHITDNGSTVAVSLPVSTGANAITSTGAVNAGSVVSTGAITGTALTATTVSASGLVTATAGASIATGINNNSGGVINTGAISGATLQQASSGNSVNLLNVQQVIAGLVGNATDQTVYTYTIPALTIQAGKGIRLTTAFNHTAAGGATTYKIIFGGTTVLSLASALNGFMVVQLVIFNYPGVTNQQAAIAFPIIIGSTPLSGGGTTVTAIDTTAGVILKSTFNAAGTETVVGSGWLVELIQ